MDALLLCSTSVVSLVQNIFFPFCICRKLPYFLGKVHNEDPEFHLILFIFSSLTSPTLWARNTVILNGGI